jgi:hypothetical protein
MKYLDSAELAKYLIRHPVDPERYFSDRYNAVMVIPYGTEQLRVIAAAGGGWDHVSVSLEHRCPLWEEMKHVHKLLFRDDEVAMQLHLPETDHINIHPFVLHMWRPRHTHKIPLPPKAYV